MHTLGNTALNCTLLTWSCINLKQKWYLNIIKKITVCGKPPILENGNFIRYDYYDNYEYYYVYDNSYVVDENSDILQGDILYHRCDPCYERNQTSDIPGMTCDENGTFSLESVAQSELCFKFS